MVLWGGSRGNRELSDGAAWAPRVGRWRPLPAAPIAGRWGHVAVWTGQEMLVWGGSGGSPAIPGATRELSDGAIYSPASDRWRPMPAFPLPARAEPAVVGGGDHLVVWGGDNRPQENNRSDGAVYSASRGTWTVMRAGPLPGRSHPNVAAMGDRLLIVGGSRFGETGSRLDGAIYDPTTDTWTSMRPAPAAIECILSCDPAIWTGREAVFTAANLAYDPSTDQWRALPECGAAGGGVAGQAGVWTGDRILTWGGADYHGESAPAAAYVPAADRWAALEDPPFPLARLHSTAVWSGTEMVVWGGGSKDEHGSTDPTDGAAYQPGAGSEAPCPSRPLYAD